MFGDPANFQKEYLDFEVVYFASPYHALLGQPCYAKFMALAVLTVLRVPKTQDS